MKQSHIIAGIVVVALIAFFIYDQYGMGTFSNADYKKVTITISGRPIVLGTQGTQYFGNEVRGDINGDGAEDIAFLITDQPGGSGTFYYLAAAVKTPDGYKGTQAMLIGDRVAPQTTEFKNGLVIVNYADRLPLDPMTTQPHVGKSIYAKYDPAQNDFGEVVQNFEGETR